MVNRLSIERRTQIIGALVEGNSIRSVERMTNTHRDTVMRLGFEVGKGCHKLMHEKMRNLHCEQIQCDEIWSYVRKKQAQLKPGESIRAGDFWTFVAIDPQTKLVPSYLTGKRTLENATMFMRDLARRAFAVLRVGVRSRSNPRLYDQQACVFLPALQRL